jgi:hypothetical protein
MLMATSLLRLCRLATKVARGRAGALEEAAKEGLEERAKDNLGATVIWC